MGPMLLGKAGGEELLRAVTHPLMSNKSSSGFGLEFRYKYLQLECLVMQASSSENINEILHIIKTMYIYNGMDSVLGTNFRATLLINQAYMSPTEALSCLLDSDLESALPVGYCLGWTMFLFDECCSLDECLVPLRDLCSDFDMQTFSLHADGRPYSEP